MAANVGRSPAMPAKHLTLPAVNVVVSQKNWGPASAVGIQKRKAQKRPQTAPQVRLLGGTVQLSSGQQLADGWQQHGLSSGVCQQRLAQDVLRPTCFCLVCTCDPSTASWTRLSDM